MTIKLDPVIEAALMPFSPMIKTLAIALVDGYIKAINEGNETAADIAESNIDAASGKFGEAVRTLLRVIDTPAGLV